MKIRYTLSIILAAVLQIAPFCRVASLAPAINVTGVSSAFQWLAGAAVLLGGYQAVSAASAAISGFAPVNPTTLLPIGAVTTNGVAAAGKTNAFRIIVTNPGVNTNDAYYAASGLPPGLTINTNFGGNGVITGVPTTTGFYTALLWAGNKLSALVVYKNVNFTVNGGSVSPPTVTSSPASQIVAAGTTVSLTVGASGTPVNYQWYYNSNLMTGSTLPTLTLTNAPPGASGYYFAQVSNSGGTNRSSNARLLVVSPPTANLVGGIGLTVPSATLLTMSFAASAGYVYQLQSIDDLATTNWVAVSNFPAAYDPYNTSVSLDFGSPVQRFYRLAARVGP